MEITKLNQIKINHPKLKNKSPYLNQASGFDEHLSYTIQKNKIII